MSDTNDSVPRHYEHNLPAVPGCIRTTANARRTLTYLQPSRYKLKIDKKVQPLLRVAVPVRNNAPIPNSPA